MPTVVQVASWLEFGTSRQLPRPLISAWADENADRVVREMRDTIARALKRKASPAQAIDRLMQKYAGEIQKRISAGVPPPNRPGTVAKKGSSKPWIDTGVVRASIKGKVSSGS